MRLPFHNAVTVTLICMPALMWACTPGNEDLSNSERAAPTVCSDRLLAEVNALIEGKKISAGWHANALKVIEAEGLDQVARKTDACETAVSAFMSRIRYR